MANFPSFDPNDRRGMNPALLANRSATDLFEPGSTVKPLALAGQYMVPQILRDAVYDGVANNRYSIMGKRDECRFDADGEFDDRFVDENLADS